MLSKIIEKIPDQYRKHVLLAIVVVTVGLPLNYYGYSAWQKTDAIVNSKNAGDNTGQATSFRNDEENTIQKLPKSDLVQTSFEDADNINNELPSLVTVEVLKDIPVTSNKPIEKIAEIASVSSDGESPLEHAQKHADPKFVCPMHPDVITEDPDATCPICGMDLVVLENLGDSEVVQLSSTIINALGVRTAKVKRGNIYRKINSVGYVSFNEKNIRRVSLRTEGWIEKLEVKSIGDRVKFGDLLFQVYSPKLVNAQEEYVQALNLDNGDGILIGSSENRLRALGVSISQISQLRESGVVEQLINIYAPQDGVITELNIREGAFIPRSTSVVSLADLSSVWLLVDIFESQIDWVKEGQNAEARLGFMPDKIWDGTVEYIYPSLDPKTRSAKARLRFNNSDELLKPNMYANVTIFAKPKRKVLTVPREAVIRTGNQARVILAQGEGKFKPAIVHTGVETNRKTEIIGGVEEGQEVVVSSQFLIDSESSKQVAFKRLSGG